MVFAPQPEAMYAPDRSVWVDETTLSKVLCGKSRPIHFRGVLTVVTKLFHLALPDVAVFGRKDAQQAILIKRMVRDLDFPVEIVLGDLIRDDDGVAMSSRNRYLSEDERRRARSISQAVLEAQKLLAGASLAEVAPVAAEVARIGVAKSLWYPKFYINGTLGLESVKAHKLFERDALFGSIGPSVSWPIFRGGSIYANIKAQEAKMHEKCLAYELQLQNAYAEVRSVYASYTQEYHRYQALQGAALL